MIRSRFSLLGVLLAAVGLMALFASAAQAEPAAKWWVLTGTGSFYTDAELEANKEKFTGSLENNIGTLLTEILKLKVAIKCTAGELIDALLAANGGVKNGAKVKFTGCAVFSGGTEGLEKAMTKCEVHSAGQPVGTVETETGHALIKLHQLLGGPKDDTVLILPDNAEELFVTLEMGNACSFGENVPVFGLFSIQDCGGTSKWLQHLVTHLITEFALLTKLWVFSDTAEHLNTRIDGSANIQLASGKSFMGEPA